MQKLYFSKLLDTLNNYDAYLFDLWGVIIEGQDLYEGVIENINRIISQKEVFFISNAPRPVASSFQRLKSWGLNVTPEMIFTSGEIARKMISESKKLLNIETPIIYHLGSDRNEDILANASFQETQDITKANILLLSLYRDEEENIDEFDELLQEAAHRGITAICSNPDTIIPNQGKLRYCAGYFATKLEKLGGKVIYTGKPGKQIFEESLNALPRNIQKNRIVMIGDTFDTDILGANHMQIHSAAVTSGNMSKYLVGCQSTEEKLAAIEKVSENLKIYPNFVTEIV